MDSIRPMQDSDVAPIIVMINEFDDEDAEAASSEFERYGIDNHFVIVVNGVPVGVCGFRHSPATKNTSWLSWFYLASDHRGCGLGKAMLQYVLNELTLVKCRKIFVKVSDYTDANSLPVYESALVLYRKLGFIEELCSLDFYSEGENQSILGLVLEPIGTDKMISIMDERPAIHFTGVHEITDSDGAFTFRWSTSSKFSLRGATHFTEKELHIGLVAAVKAGARKVFLTFPSNLPLIHTPLQTSGFKMVGRLSDYYEFGLDELHFSHGLHQIQ